MKAPETPQLTPLQQAATSRKLLEAEIISRAWADDAFRKTLETDPVSALTAAGLPLPEGKTIRVITETSDTLTLVIPPLPAQTEEATDDELEAVAGGGLLQNGRCQIYDNSRKKGSEQTNKFLADSALIYGAVIGVSWGWG